MPWIITLIYICIAYYTFKIAIKEWKARNKFASINIMIMALALIVASIYVEFIKTYG
jgi:hypothetical protein